MNKRQWRNIKKTIKSWKVNKNVKDKKTRITTEIGTEGTRRSIEIEVWARI
jgi:hypothetical protein